MRKERKAREPNVYVTLSRVRGSILEYLCCPMSEALAFVAKVKATITIITIFRERVENTKKIVRMKERQIKRTRDAGVSWAFFFQADWRVGFLKKVHRHMLLQQATAAILNKNKKTMGQTRLLQSTRLGAASCPPLRHHRSVVSLFVCLF